MQERMHPHALIDLLAQRPSDELESMHAAAERVIRATTALAETGQSAVSTVMPGEDVVNAWSHYPPGDIIDPEHGTQVYYHAHPEHDRGAGEHGHFHVFAHCSAPTARPDSDSGAGNAHAPASQDDGAKHCHLIAISMNALSQPVGLFTTNRWVTGETWLPARDIVERVRSFRLEKREPFAETRQWLEAMMILFRPQIEALIAERDARIRSRATHAADDVLENRALNRISAVDIDLAEQVTAIERALSI
ncbi:MAG: DUF6969 family protein [Dichotomicrobium sp.]